MYGTIPDVVISKPPRNNQFRVVVALGVGVLIGALGTALLTPAPTPAPRPVLAVSPKMERVECYRIEDPTTERDLCFNKVAYMAILGRVYPPGCMDCIDQFKRCVEV